MQQEESRKEWKRRVWYGRRWIVEAVISAFKRMSGESVMAASLEGMVHEIMPKAATYNNGYGQGGWN